MGIYKGSVNALNLLNLRKISIMPPNFTKFQLKNFMVDMREVDRWIYLNLDGRYCIKSTATIIDNKIINKVEVGFEDSKELTMFTLACPFLNRT